MSRHRKPVFAAIAILICSASIALAAQASPTSSGASAASQSSAAPLEAMAQRKFGPALSAAERKLLHAAPMRALACSCVVNFSTNSLTCFASTLCTTQTGFCGGICPLFDFDAQVNYVEHDIGSASYGTSFAPNAAGSVASKIVALATPPSTCGTWSINLQATGQNLSGITNTPVALFLNDSDNDGAGAPESVAGAACFDVNAQIGNGITKPHRGAHHARH